MREFNHWSQQQKQVIGAAGREGCDGGPEAPGRESG